MSPRQRSKISSRAAFRFRERAREWLGDVRGNVHRWGLPGRILVKREEVMSELLRQGYEFAPARVRRQPYR